MKPPERLETERLLLRRTTEDDFDGFALVHANAARELNAAVRHWRDYGFGPWSLYDRETGEFVGVVEMHYAGRGLQGVQPDEVEMGWAIVAGRRNEGLATEAVLAAAEDTLRRVGPEWLVAMVRPDNEASLRVVEKLGMHEEGKARTRSGDNVRLFRLYPHELPLG
jgi:RimJ/RimL family protein N-acetyltransferase